MKYYTLSYTNEKNEIRFLDRIPSSSDLVGITSNIKYAFLFDEIEVNEAMCILWDDDIIKQEVE